MYFHVFSWCLHLVFTLFLTCIPLLFLSWLIICGILMVMKTNKGSKRIGIFHPYCNAGGGGERVLWVLLAALKRKYPNHQYIIYTGDQGVTKNEILSKAASTFNIDTDLDVDFVFLKTRYWIEKERYPRFTLLLQSLASMVLAAEALFKYPPDIFIDTMGYSFAYPLFKYLAFSSVITYTHFPTISLDMLENVSSRREAVNNQGFIARSQFLSNMKLVYYRLFAFIYGLMGRCADIALVNSSWTRNHITRIWGGDKIHLVYPPCNIDVFLNLSSETKNKYQIVSISQFRPEKDHIKQIHSFAKFLDKLAPEEISKAKLVLIGSCRDSGDEEQVERLRQLSESLGILDKVHFALNLTFNDLLKYMKTSNIGIHTMREEHFGIGIVELMAAGLITVAHNSGGPKLDIIRPGENGFLSETVDEYAETLLKIVRSNEDQLNTIRSNAQKYVAKFSEKNFCSEIIKIFADYLK